MKRVGQAAPASFGCTLVKSLQQLAADTVSPHVGVDKDHGHVAIAGDDRSSPVLRPTGFSQRVATTSLSASR